MRAQLGVLDHVFVEFASLPMNGEAAKGMALHDFKPEARCVIVCHDSAARTRGKRDDDE